MIVVGIELKLGTASAACHVGLSGTATSRVVHVDSRNTTWSAATSGRRDTCRIWSGWSPGSGAGSLRIRRTTSRLTGLT